MKKSIYYSIIEIDNKRLLIYNALQDKYLSCAKEEWQAFENGLDITPIFLDKLHEIGLLIDDDINESDIAKNLMDEVDQDPTILLVHVNPTLQCNLNCWYCYENHIPSSKMQPETVNAVIRYMHNRLEDDRIKHLQLAFFGGEPLLYFNDVVKPLISAAKELAENSGIPFSVHFTSNATLLNENIIGFLKPFNVSFQITLDGGKEAHDKVRHMKGVGTYELILKNIMRLATTGKRVVLRVNFTADNVDTVPAILDEIAGWPSEIKSNIHIDLQQVWQDIGKDNEDNISNKIHLMMETAASNGFAISSPWKATNIKHSCYGDKLNHILINYNGDLYFCTARDFKPENRKGYLSEDGYPVWENDSLRKHMSVKFSNPTCRNCRIGPLCGGGCRQKAYETMGRSGCPLGFTEYDKDDIILKRFERFIIVPRIKPLNLNN
ncbi:MAG: radical SAM protein [Bacteroidales bacterium]|nr:radical SAM protein [Bacteroidales bacterium]